MMKCAAKLCPWYRRQEADAKDRSVSFSGARISNETRVSGGGSRKAESAEETLLGG